MHWARQARRVGCNASLTCGDRVVRANLSPDVAKAWMAVVSAWSAGAGRAGSGAAAKGKSVTAGPEQCEWTGKEDELVCVQVWYGHSVCMVAQNIVCAWSSARYILQKADDTSHCQTPDAVLRARPARAFKTIPNASSEASQVTGLWCLVTRPVRISCSIPTYTEYACTRYSLSFSLSYINSPFSGTNI